MTTRHSRTLLLVANFDSSTGYAWSYIERYWVAISEVYAGSNRVAICYPTLSRVSGPVTASGIEVLERRIAPSSLPELLRTLNFLRSRRVDCIYFTDRPLVHWTYVLYRLAGVRKIIVHDHTGGVRKRATGARRLLKTLLARMPFAPADAAFGATAFVTHHHEVVACFPGHKCYTVPNGIPPLRESGNGPAAAPLEFPAGRKIVVSIGRAQMAKGLHFALETMRCLVVDEGRRNLHYLHCGDGPDLEELKGLAERLGISSYVTFAGHRTDISRILPQCFAGFHPSTGEAGYSLSILECMRAGLPVVVPDNPSVNQATAHDRFGLHYREGDAKDAACAIARLLDDEPRARSMGQLAAAEQRNRYTEERAHHALTVAMRAVYPRETLAQSG